MDRVIIFLTLSVLIIIVSWRTLFSVQSHGFYRFFSWECIVWLFATNYKYWFNEPFAINHIVSWILLIIAAYLVIAGILLMKTIGKPEKSRNEKALYQFEQTTELIDKGIFKYIRHPLYSSLLFLTWAIFFKNTSTELLVVSFLSTIFLYVASLFDEKECIAVFGERYKDYMKRSKRFIPYII